MTRDHGSHARTVYAPRMHAASWAALAVAVVTAGCKNTEPGPSTTTGRPVATPPVLAADARAVAWPEIDCAAIVTVEDLAARCGRRPSAALAARAEGEVVDLPPPNKRHRIICDRRLELNPKATHVLSVQLVGFTTLEASRAQDALLVQAGQETASSRTAERYTRHDRNGVRGRVHYGLFETIPTSAQPLCGAEGLRAVDALLQERLPRM